MKFLIDECLSPGLAQMAKLGGHAGSMHVTWLGLASRRDRDVANRALADDFVLVSNNSKDFLKLYAEFPIHPGLVCLNASFGLMNKAVQDALFRLCLTTLADDPINEVVDITLRQDRSIEVRLYAWPQTGML